MKNNNLEMAGKVSFIVGLLLAILAGVIPAVAGFAYTALILVLLGLVVGFLNITEKNVLTLLVAIIALVTVGNATLNVIPGVSTYLTAMLQYFLAFVGAAGLVVAVKAIITVSKK
ncbi:MAG TPA: hypothetical protein VJ438_04305 [Candidatus Nanoarchaeia archaeon]|nr:hypothetical protein [Candidatus Nanoarchaeia archaeon]